MTRTAARLFAENATLGLSTEVTAGLPDCVDRITAAADPAHGFLRRAWFEAAAPNGATTIVVRDGDGRSIAALPLARARLSVARIDAVPGSYWPFRMIPIAADASDDALDALFAAAGQAWRLGPVYAEDRVVTRLVAAATRGGWSVLERSVGTSFILPLGALVREGWPRASTRKGLRRRERALAEEGRVEWREIRGPDWGDAAFDELAAVEAASWIARRTDGRDAKFLAPHHRAFWSRAARDPAIAQRMAATMLLLGGRPVAFSFDLDCGSIQYGIASSYDTAMARHSPGQLVTYRALAASAARGIETVDWGAGDDGYKRAIGAVAGPRMIDLLFVRNPALARVIRPIWRRIG